MKLLAFESGPRSQWLSACLTGRGDDISLTIAGPRLDGAPPDGYRVLPFEQPPGWPAPLPSVHGLAALLADVSPDACLVRGEPAFARVARAVIDSVGLPVFQFLETEAQLGELVRLTKPRPDLFFVVNEALLPAVLTDERYGSTILPLGDLFGGEPSHAHAPAQRLATYVQDWWSGRLPSPQPALSIVVPAFREAANLSKVSERLMAMVHNSGLEAELLLIDDASPDDTYRAALNAMFISPRIRAFTKPVPRGMGNAIRYGISRARADVITITMGDGSDDVDRIPEMVREIVVNGNSLAIGCRYRQAENFAAIPGIYRFWSRIFRIAARILIGISLNDYTNAFRTFRRNVLSRYGLESGGFEISPEITFKSWFATRRVAEVDVRHLKRSSGQSKFSFLRAGPGYGKILLKALVNRLTGRWFVLDW